jgi:hypothetical protein
MSEPKPTPLVQSTPGIPTPERPVEPAYPRGSGQITGEIPRERSEHSVMEGLPEWKAERVAAMRRELAELQRQLIESQQRIATELQGRADDAERYETLETRLQEQEQRSQRDAARATELETEIASLRSTTEKARADIAARDAQIEEARQAHRNLTEQIEGHRALLQETKTALETRDAELATRTTERDGARSQIERALEDERKKHQAIAEQLEVQTKAATDAKALALARDAELATTKSERDAARAESEQTKRELDAARAKARDVASQHVRFGQELTDGTGAARTDAEPRPTRPSEPPPLPRRAQPPMPPLHRTAQVDAPIIDVTADAKPTSSRAVSLLLMVGGVVLGCAATILIMNATSASSTAAAYQQAPATQPTEPAAVPPPSAAINVEAEQAAAVPVALTADNGANPAAIEMAPAGAGADSTTGVILLPPEAAGHRLFVDGRVVDVDKSRAEVACGTREVKIGSRGVAQKLDVACGGSTELPAIKK